MYMNVDFFNTYIDDRLQTNYHILLDNPKYVTLVKQFNKDYRTLSNSLSPEKVNQLEKIIDLKNVLLSNEVYLSYKIGFKDALDLKNTIK